LIGSCAIASAICLELASIPIEAGRRHCGAADSGAAIPAGGVEGTTSALFDQTSAVRNRSADLIPPLRFAPEAKGRQNTLSYSGFHPDHDARARRTGPQLVHSSTSHLSGDRTQTHHTDTSLDVSGGCS
jgi:hypothetical protein